MKHTKSYFDLKRGSIADLYARISSSTRPLNTIETTVTETGSVTQPQRRPPNPTHIDDDGFIPIRRKGS